MPPHEFTTSSYSLTLAGGNNCTFDRKTEEPSGGKSLRQSFRRLNGANQASVMARSTGTEEGNRRTCTCSWKALDVREGIIRCILATDMARHNEILTQFQEATPNFDYSNKVHTNLLCMVLIKVADISNEARPMDVAEPWVDRLLLEFFAQSAAEKSEGLPVTPFMDPDKVSKPGSQVRFIGLVLLPLFEALGELLPELTDLIITPVRVALDYYKRLNDAANKTRRSIAEAEAASSESGGSPQLPRSQSGISVKSRRSIPSQKSASRTSVDEPILIAAELHDLPEGSESGDSETATEVDVAEKTAKFKVDTESIHRKQSHPNSRKGSREKRPSMIGEYYTTGTRTRGSHGNIQHTNNRTYFGSNRAISLDQYSNNRRMSDGVPIQTVHSDNSVLYYHHQRQHRSLDHDTMCSSSDKSTSLNSTHDAPGRGGHEDSENMNLHVPPPNTGKRLGKLFGSGTTGATVTVANLKNNNGAGGTEGGGKAGGRVRQESIGSGQGGNAGGIDGTISGSVGVADGGSVDDRGGGGGGVGATTGATGVVSSSSGSKSFMSRLRQLTGRLSFSFDSRESKKLHLIATGAGHSTAVTTATTTTAATIPMKHADHQRSKLTITKGSHLLEGSRPTVDIGGPVAICGGPGMTIQQGGALGVGGNRSIPVGRGRAYSLDVPIGGRNCCRSLSGSTTGGGAGSSCGGSHKSLTFSLNNKSLNEDNDAGSLALVSTDRKSNSVAPMRNGTDPSLLLLVDDPSTSSIHHTNSSYEPSLQGILLTSTSLQADSPSQSHQHLGPAAAAPGTRGTRPSVDSDRRAPFAESESISSKHTSALVSYWICLTERMSSLICKCCERTLPPAESV
ncbi:high-affinity cgmp-specific 3,5-cyclic phosphodiesterase [Anopheles sinensis]|uniref:High-affinity cgmp-specific 3,5-cyclic phosphodiesterase n=1 Tax=Anopheles sinensis TaxID=74873 RepID=A0A084VH78_ANOSI|nr:high-affinity cgmp-specific 3,5-cyclic phosphodiesterase [Anopheles sinensis]